MEQFDLYKDISQRTNGDIYIGVVGPVRSWQIHLYKKVHGSSGSAQHRR